MSLPNSTENTSVTNEPTLKKDPQITALALARLRQVQSELEKESALPSTTSLDQMPHESATFSNEFCADDFSMANERIADFRPLWMPWDQRKGKRKSRGGYRRRNNGDRFINQKRNVPMKRSPSISNFDSHSQKYHPNAYQNVAENHEISHKLGNTPEYFPNDRFTDIPYASRSSSGEYQNSHFNCAGYSSANLNHHHAAPDYQQSTDMNVTRSHGRRSRSTTPDRFRTYNEFRPWESSSYPHPSFRPYKFDDVNENPVHEYPDNYYADSLSLQRNSNDVYQYRKNGMQVPTSSSMSGRRTLGCETQSRRNSASSSEFIEHDRFRENRHFHSGVVSPRLMQTPHLCSSSADALIVERESVLTGHPFSPRDQHLGDSSSVHTGMNSKRRRMSYATSVASSANSIPLRTRMDYAENLQENEFTSYERRNTASSDSTLAERTRDRVAERMFCAQESLPHNWVSSCPNPELSVIRGNDKIQCWIVVENTRPSAHIAAIQSLFRERCSVSPTVVYDDTLRLYGGRELLNYLDCGRANNAIGPSGQTLVRAAVLVGSDFDHNSFVRIVVEENCGELQDAENVTSQDGVALVLRTVLRASMSRSAKEDGRMKESGKVTDDREVNLTRQPVELNDCRQEAGHETHPDVLWSYGSRSHPPHQSSISATHENPSRDQRSAGPLPAPEWHPVVNTNLLHANSRGIETPANEHYEQGSMYQCASRSRRPSTPAPSTPTNVGAVLTPGVKSMLSTLQQQIELGHDIGGLSILSQCLPRALMERNPAYPESGDSRSPTISLTSRAVQQMQPTPVAHGGRPVSSAGFPSDDVKDYRHLEELLAKLHTPEIDRAQLAHPTESPLSRPLPTQLEIPLQPYAGRVDGSSGLPTSAGNSDIPFLPKFSPISSQDSSSKASAPASTTRRIPTPPPLTARSEGRTLPDDRQAPIIPYRFPFTPSPDAKDQAFPSNTSDLGSLPTLKNLPDVKSLTSILAAARATGIVEQFGVGTGIDHRATVSTTQITQHGEGGSLSPSLNVKELDLLVQKLQSNRQVSGIAEIRSDGDRSM